MACGYLSHKGSEHREIMGNRTDAFIRLSNVMQLLLEEFMISWCQQSRPQSKNA